ncbi:hypothetical protein [Yokenella regensburgei]|uniref:hypothetical protein n=1 Tax=Yokenella regensburgei TaxID=158877 RepID=UPI003ED84F5B
MIVSHSAAVRAAGSLPPAPAQSRQPAQQVASVVLIYSFVQCERSGPLILNFRRSRNEEGSQLDFPSSKNTLITSFVS